MILEFVDTLRERFATTGKKLDFGEWSKWFMYDVVTDVTFGEPIGFVREGKDIGKLLQAFHELAPLAGLIAALPWLMNPLLKNDFFGRRFLMPKAGDSRGGGRIMEVSLTDLNPLFAKLTNETSTAIRCLKTD